MADRCDVVVVGAGPSGSTAASLFARLGLRVVLLDRAHFPRPKACAEYMSPGVVDKLTELGLDEPVRSREPHRLSGMEIVSARGRRLRIDYRVGVSSRQAWTLPRLDLDATLVEAAVRAGAELREGWPVDGLLQGTGSIRGVSVGRGRGSEILAPLTIIADGAGSGLARQLGLWRRPIWPVRLGLVAHYEGDATLGEGFGEMHVGARAYCGVAPLPHGRLNVAAVVEPLALRRARLSAADYLDALIRDWPALGRTLAGCRRAGRVRGVLPTGARSSRVSVAGAMLVGDAASFFDPFTGEGLYRALESARMAADVGVRALELGEPTAARLAEYGRMRRAAFTRKEAVTALVQVFVRWPRLLDYVVPRLEGREPSRRRLGLVLGDIGEAGELLRPSSLWEALRP